ncbi:hypothetical protein [Amycolatopsis suaedae]|uniref:Secreted protein n=1 Tax=Amycolatopsis suaedae TaxID=2510978 RepID=A0A4Q7IYB8_9PSEU|nr:hypothetical protein [Amycolatopsis suaedae]RZQ59960.1 hypothetical protein EWH70_31505 [Amycolatopsis suaedae]
MRDKRTFLRRVAAVSAAAAALTTLGSVSASADETGVLDATGCNDNACIKVEGDANRYTATGWYQANAPGMNPTVGHFVMTGPNLSLTEVDREYKHLEYSYSGTSHGAGQVCVELVTTNGTAGKPCVEVS